MKLLQLITYQIVDDLRHYGYEVGCEDYRRIFSTCLNEVFEPLIYDGRRAPHD